MDGSTVDDDAKTEQTSEFQKQIPSINPHTMEDVEECRKCIEQNLISLHDNIRRAYDSVPNNKNRYPQLLAVSKLKPKQLLIEAYKHGHRHFGENYIQELFDKATDPEIQEKCPDIHWHMIGHVQSNKIRKLLTVPNLFCIQTVDSLKLAEQINSAISRIESFDKDTKINVLAQINTSGEEGKSGIEPSKASELVKFIVDKCDRLNLCGLMTIGAYGYDPALGPNPDFLKLIDIRKEVAPIFGKPESEIELSMGMTADYEQAITMGSTIVRVGVAIFGQRWRVEKK